MRTIVLIRRLKYIIVMHTTFGVMRRADNIVRDAEAVRMAMVPPDAPGGGRWTLLGQSFGGFCVARSLSRFLICP